MKNNRAKDASEREACVTPATVKNILNSLRQYFNFSVGSHVYVGVYKFEVDVTLLRLSEMSKVLKNDTIQRRTEVKERKADNLITPEITLVWGRSAYLKGVGSFLAMLHGGNI